MGRDGEIAGDFWQSGSYSLINAKGQTKTVEVTGVPAPIDVAGPWQVTFQPLDGSAKETTFDVLSDWTKHADAVIRYFSGKATYRTVFTVTDSSVGRQLSLDLRDVRGLATVRLNGQDLGTLWTKPWHVDATGAVQRGENELEVDVVNPWQNRLVGDARLPPEKRRTFLMQQTVPNNLPLQPAGLLGPVTLRTAETITVNGARE